MSIEKFEVGKKYRFLKDGDGDRMYGGVDAKARQEFTVSLVDTTATTKDVTYKGNYDPIGWSVYSESDEDSPTTLDDFEEVVIDSGEENTNTDLIQQMIALQQEYSLMMEFYNGEVIINFENNDTEYKISTQKELTTLIEASNVLKSFERK